MEHGVFRQQAGVAWFPVKTTKLSITVLMPQSGEPVTGLEQLLVGRGPIAETALPSDFLPYPALDYVYAFVGTTGA